MGATGWALVSAFFGGLGVVLQQKGAIAAPPAGAAVMNVFVDVAPNGIDAILSSWSTYALIVSALGGFYFLQTALQVGVLAPAIAGSNAACPITSVVLGRIVFLQTPQRTTGGKIASAVSAVLLLAGLVLLARREATQQLDAARRPPTSAAG